MSWASYIPLMSMYLALSAYVKDVDKGGARGAKAPPVFLHALLILEVSTCTPGSVLYVE